MTPEQREAERVKAARAYLKRTEITNADSGRFVIRYFADGCSEIQTNFFNGYLAAMEAGDE